VDRFHLKGVSVALQDQIDVGSGVDWLDQLVCTKRDCESVGMNSE
jgi:hypothetical protein